MSRVVFLTRTDWSEPPRLRHQLARLLASYGHSVYFCERPAHSPGALGEVSEAVHAEERIQLLRYYEPVHHQLKLGPVTYAANNAIVMRSLRQLDSRVRPDVVFNFNHDYAFARRAFPSATFVTMINDDFEGMARPWIRRATTRRLADTCRVSDVVFAVSHPLVRRLQSWSSSAELFLPWLQEPYAHPNPGRSRNVALYYGYINEKIDWTIVHALARSRIPMRFVGPVDPSVEGEVMDLRRSGRLELLQPSALADVPVEDVCCSIVPYDARLPYVRVMTAGNRLFQLLGQGLPVAHVSLPDLIDAPESVVRKCETPQSWLRAVESASSEFDAVQPDIKRFLEEHTPARRYAALVDRVPRLREGALAT